MSGHRKGLGNVVVIDHGNGWMSTYAHCDALNVNVGDQVSRGDIIATVGETGAATGPHLHLELRKDGVLVNPTDVLELSAEDDTQVPEDLSGAQVW